MAEPPCRPFNTPADAPAHPGWDHSAWPYAPREGIQSAGNNRYLTVALFLETARQDALQDVRYVLDDHDLWVPSLKRWLPSARLIYVNALDEYDAVRKLVGNMTQWERLFKMTEFSNLIDEWRIEQRHIQRLAVRQTLKDHMESGLPGNITAARALLQLIDKNPVGRPQKGKPQPQTLPDDEKDHLRLVAASGERVSK